MTYTSISETLTKLATRVIKSSRFVALVMVATVTFVAIQPAQAQSADTWKSIAIIGGSTAAGAYIGHKVGGSTGTFVGAAVGASAGYAIDKRRRANGYNQYGDNGYYGTNDGYYENNGGSYGNGGYDGGSYGNDGSYQNGGYPYPSAYRSSNYQSRNYYQNSNRCARRR